MKNSQTYLLIYKKNYIESLLSRKKFSTKETRKIKELSANNQDYHSIQKLFDWAKDKGGIFDNFHIKYLDLNNRYVTAKNSINKSDLIAKFPEELIFSKSTNQIAEIYEAVRDMDYSDQIAVYVFFVKEFLKGEDSCYHQYIKTLPMDTSCFPHYFHSNLKEYIKGSLLEKEILDQIKLFTKEFETLKQRELATFSFEDYMKIRLILGARLFEVSSKENRCGLIPVADLCNYDPEKINTKWTYDQKNKCFTIKALNYIGLGDEIFLQYGSQNNIYFLSWYGFTLNKNPEKIKEYPIEYEESALTTKVKKIPQIKLNKDLDLYSVIVELSALMEIEEFVNGFYCFNDAVKNGRPHKKEDPRKELINKLKLVLHKLKTLIRNKIENYFNETIDKDKELYSSGVKTKNFNLINIFNVIIEEKEILLNYVNLINDFEIILDNFNDNAKKAKLIEEFHNKYPYENLIIQLNSDNKI